MKHVQDFDKNMATKESVANGIKYFDAKDAERFKVYGTNALNEDGFSRLCVERRKFIEPISDGVAWFSKHSSGIQVKFTTDATDIFVRVKLTGKFDMTNMTQIGQCGLDLYVYADGTKGFIFHSVAHGKFDSDFYDEKIGDFNQLGSKKRRFIINLPLYIGVCDLQIGVNEWAAVTPDYFTNEQKIAVYGTSITHGCCASHPGMAYTNILSRRLDTEVFNFGFSGVAMNEPEMADVLSDNEYDILIVDTEPNAGCSMNLKNNLKPFLDRFFAVRPKTTVILMSRMMFALDYFDLERVKLNKLYIKFMNGVAKEYAKRGYDVHFYNQSRVFGKNFSEYTTDGVHPTDLGMVKIADFYEKTVKKVNALTKVTE